MRFKEQTIVVTGAGYGIGKVVAQAFAREGANVVLAARSREKMESVAEELRNLDTRPLVMTVDVSSEEDVKRLFGRVREDYDGLDVLVNNAGIAGPTALARDVTAEEWKETLDINLTGAFFCAREASTIMIEQSRGSIVNITSIGGRIGYPLRTPYAASKWGMIGLSHSLAAELGAYGIRVNAVAPGPIEGERINQVIAARAESEGMTFEQVREGFLQPIPLKRMPTEQEVADMVLLLASDSTSAVTGQVMHVDGGFRMQ